MVIYRCSNCGAKIVTSKNTSLTNCIYCNYATTYPDKITDEATPDVVIPFTISKEDAMKTLNKHCKSSLLIPRKIRKCIAEENVIGVFVPSLLYSLENNANTTLICEKTETCRKDDDKVITKHQYEVNVNTSGMFNRIPSNIITHIDEQTMKELEPYNIDNLIQFKASCLNGYYYENFNGSQDKFTKIAKEKASEITKKEVAEKMSTFDKIKIKEHSDHFDNITSELALFPVWLLQIPHNGKIYKFAVNGETGKIAGKLPLSMLKLLLLCTSIFVIAQAIGIAITALL